MLGLEFGEWFVVAFILVSIFAAPYSGALGAALERWFTRARRG
jgi:hypothetical protein